MNKRFFLSLVACFLMGMSAFPQTSIRDVFKQLPDSVFPYLTHDNRLDFIDFMDSNMKAEVTNLFGGKSEMTYIDNDSISLQLNNMTRVELFLVKARTTQNDTLRQIVCMATTWLLDGKDEDCRLCLYETDGQSITSDCVVGLNESDKRRIERFKSSTVLNYYDRTVNNN